MVTLVCVAASFSQNVVHTRIDMSKTSDDELKQKLTPEQYYVTRQDGTEPPFHNAYWDNHAPGIYVDVVSGVPLFSSLDKFDSGTGWPSFTRPIDPAAVKNVTDTTHSTVRTEVRSTGANSHLGHVFDDGPEPTGKRYCMNSAALRFVPVEKLAAEGYGRFLPDFAKAGVTVPPVLQGCTGFEWPLDAEIGWLQISPLESLASGTNLGAF